MFADFRLTKVVERRGVVRFTGATSDDRVDFYNTRCTQELFQDWIVNAKADGYPWLTVAHYPREVAHVGDIDRMWIQGHYFKISGLFHDTPLGRAAAQSVLNDKEGRIRLSSGFGPTAYRGEAGGVTAFTAGYLEHSALTTVPANSGAYITAQVVERASGRFTDASNIVGEQFARELERAYVEYLIEVTGQQLVIPRSLSQWERIYQMDLFIRSRLGSLVTGHSPIICTGDVCAVGGELGVVVLGSSCLDADELELDDPVILGWTRALLLRSSYKHLAQSSDRELVILLSNNLQARVELQEVSPASLKAVDDQEAISLHWRTHQLYAQMVEGRQFAELTEQTLQRVHKYLSAELLRRGLQHNQHDELDRLATRFVPQFLESLRRPVTLVPEYVSLGGSSLRTDAPHDTDVIIRKPREQRNTSEEVALRRQLDPDKSRELRYIYAPEGPHDDYVPLYDLTLSPIESTQLAFVQAGQGVVRSRAPSRPDWIRDMAEVLEHLEGQDILEMGCGAGYSLAVLQEAGYTPLGVDSDDSEVEACHQLGLQALQGNVQETSFEDQSFDTVFSMHVLEHVDDPWAVVEESVRLARRKAFHIVPLGHRRHPDHKWEWFTVQDLVEAFPDAKIYSLPSSDSAMIVSLETILRSVLTRSGNLKPLSKFRPTKTGSAYSQQEFEDVERFYTEWAKGYVEEGIPLAVEEKYNGWRLILQYDGKDTLIYFEDSKKDRSTQFPDLVADLKAIGQPVILDAELGAVSSSGRPIPRKDLAYWGGNEQVPLSFETPGGVKGILTAHVFDVLYFGGDLHDKPWKERRQTLSKLMGAVDTKILVLGEVTICRTKAAVLKAVARVSKLPGSEGAVIKAVGSPYNITGNTTGWAKVKTVFECKVKVEERIPIKGSSELYGYKIQYFDSEGVLQSLGRTMNTVVKANPADILTITVQEVIPKKLDSGAWGISVVVPRVRDLDTDRRDPEDALTIIRRAEEAGLLQTTDAVLKELHSDKVLRYQLPVVVRSNITFRPGMRGTGVLQLHERGLSRDQALGFGRKFYLGLEPVVVTIADYQILHDALDADWQGAVAKAGSGDSSKLGELVQKVDRDKLSRSQRLVLAKVEPVSIHTDVRLRPSGEDWWEGGEFFTPGNQFQPNKVELLDEGISIQFDWKRARKDEDGGEGSVRGPLSWLHVGSPVPAVFPPGTTGATTNAWGRMTVIDRFRWLSGTQDDHYKEFRFVGKILSGRYIIGFAPVSGRRIWLVRRPERQEMDKESTSDNSRLGKRETNIRQTLDKL